MIEPRRPRFAHRLPSAVWPDFRILRHVSKVKEVFGFHSNVPDHFDALIRNGFKRNLSTIPPGNLVGGAGILGLVHWIIFHRGRFPMAARLPPA